MRLVSFDTSIHSHLHKTVLCISIVEHGARLAWRNAPKCANRKYWQQLKLLDCREVDTNQGMFDSCIKHLTKAMACGSSEPYITVFRSETPGTSDGPRIWNDQLLQYAAYNQDGCIIGDPKNVSACAYYFSLLHILMKLAEHLSLSFSKLRFTQMLAERFNWSGPPDGELGAHDYLPLIIQSDPKVDPELFAVPLECASPVHIHHPQHPEISMLGKNTILFQCTSSHSLCLISSCF